MEHRRTPREDVQSAAKTSHLFRDRGRISIGGMEVRMMAIAAMEKVGLDAMDVSTKAKAMGMLQAYASRGNFEPEARRRAQEAAARIEASLKRA